MEIAALVSFAVLAFGWAIAPNRPRTRSAEPMTPTELAEPLAA